MLTLAHGHEGNRSKNSILNSKIFHSREQFGLFQCYKAYEAKVKVKVKKGDEIWSPFLCHTFCVIFSNFQRKLHPYFVSYT